MADLLRIAKERRDTLLAEIARLDDFLCMAEALEEVGQSAVHAADDLMVGTSAHPLGLGLPRAVEGDGSATSDHADTRADTHVNAEAPALLLTHHSEDPGSAHSGVAATVYGAMALASEARLAQNTFADYLDALRERIEHHFGTSRNPPGPVSAYADLASRRLSFANSVLVAATPGTSETTTVSGALTFIDALRERIQRYLGNSGSTPALISSDAEPASRNSGIGNVGMLDRHSENPAIRTISPASAFIETLRHRIERHFGTFRSAPAPILSHAKAHLAALTFGNAAAAEPTSANRESMTASRSAGVEPTCEQGGAAIRRADAVKLAREPAGSMVDVAASIEQLRGGQTSTVQSTDRSFDIHLGQKLRQRRWMLGMSRKQLGHAIGVDGEQIERYETGLEEVDATRLWKIAAALGVPVTFFFEGLDGEAPDGGEARGEVLSGEEALMQFGDSSDDTFVFVTSRSA